MATGEVNGIMESQNETLLLGSSNTKINNPIYATNKGMVTGNINCCASDGLSTAAPIAAKRHHRASNHLQNKSKTSR